IGLGARRLTTASHVKLRLQRFRLIVTLLRRIDATMRNLARWVTAFVLGLYCIASRKRFPSILLFFGMAPGDDLLCTVVLRELRDRDSGALFMISNHRELFIGNDDVAHVFPLAFRRIGATLSVYENFIKLWGGEFITATYNLWDGIDRTEPPSRHLKTDVCAKASNRCTISLRTNPKST